MFPGAEVRILTEQKNTGTIPTKLNNIDVNLTGTDDVLKNDIQITFNCWLFDNDNHIKSTISKTCKLKDYKTTLNNLLKNTILLPNETIVVGGESVDKLMTIKLIESSGNESQNKKLTIETKFDWKQYVGSYTQNPNFH